MPEVGRVEPPKSFCLARQSTLATVSMRLQLFEFEDFEWLPGSIRDGGLDYLRYVLKATHFYDCIVPVIHQALEQTGASSIVDLCSGGGGSIEQIREQASALAGRENRSP